MVATLGFEIRRKLVLFLVLDIVHRNRFGLHSGVRTAVVKTRRSEGTSSYIHFWVPKLFGGLCSDSAAAHGGPELQCKSIRNNHMSITVVIHMFFFFLSFLDALNGIQTRGTSHEK